MRTCSAAAYAARYIMPDSLAIPNDGIIGKDFIKLYNCILDYADLSFTIRTTAYGDFTVPINHEIADGVTIPARCETTRFFKISCETFPAFIKCYIRMNLHSNAAANKSPVAV